MEDNKKFSGTDNYIATEDLMVAVNAAVTLERPLLIKGEPGTGKTVLAHEVAKALNKNIYIISHCLFILPETSEVGVCVCVCVCVCVGGFACAEK